MKIDLNSIDRESFMVHEHDLFGEKVHLVQPVHIGCSWTHENVILRSSLWDTDNKLISASWKKFVNWGEKPDVFPPPGSIEKCTLVMKLDGSTLICSKWKDNYIFRTRGTVDATRLANGAEVSVILDKYPGIKELLDDTAGVSLLFEWVSSENVIVIKYDETPDVYLTGIVRHHDYSYFTQKETDEIADLYGLKRPQMYSFDNFDELLSSVKDFQNVEGICCYYNDDQSIVKIKGDQYLKLHRFKANANIETTVDLFFALQCPTFQEFERKLIEQFDYECYTLVRGFASNVCDAYNQVLQIIDGMRSKVASLANLTRKAQAQNILQSYGETNRASMTFSLLDGKELNNEQRKKLLYQCMKQ